MLLVVWARFVDRDAGPGEPTTGTATESPDSTAEGKADVTRTVHRSSLSPNQVVPVTVTLRNVRDRVILRESVDGQIADIDASPEPVAVDGDDGSVTVYWDTADPVGDATLEYTVEIPPDAADGDVVTFEGTVESSDCRWSVGGDETATVVEDIFQRVLERGAVTAADIEVAIERDDITREEVARLRRAWLKED